MKIIKKFFFESLFIMMVSVVALGLTVRYATIEEITSNSNLIVYGKVNSIYYGWEENNIYTYTKIEIYDVFKGAEKNRQITVKQLGGKVGDISQEVSGTPRLWDNSEVFLFLVDWKEAYWINSIVLGFYEVVEINGTKFAVNNFNDVEMIDSKTGKPIQEKKHIEAKYELTSLKTKIKDLVKKELR